MILAEWTMGEFDQTEWVVKFVLFPVDHPTGVFYREDEARKVDNEQIRPD